MPDCARGRGVPRESKIIRSAGLDPSTDMIEKRRATKSSLRCLAPLTPCAMFAVLMFAGGALAPAASTRSLPLLLGCVVALVASLAALVAWVLISAGQAAVPPRPAKLTRAGQSDQWAEFEREFWSYIEASADRPPRQH